MGVTLTFFTSRQAPTPRTRRRAGIALWALVGLAVLALLGGLAHSHRGLTGSVSHAVSALTNPNAKPPPNTPGRLTAVASVRARYWKEALQVFDAHPALGAGAEGYATARLRYRKETLVVTHAHGFVVQTLADLGIVGLLVALALLGSWIVEARRADAAAQPAAAAVHARAGGAAEHALHRGRVRRPLADRLDLVRPRQRAAWRCCAPAGWPGGGRCAPGPRDDAPERGVASAGGCREAREAASPATCSWPARS